VDAQIQFYVTRKPRQRPVAQRHADDLNNNVVPDIAPHLPRPRNNGREQQCDKYTRGDEPR
jgi:hypothetical protein